MHELCVGPPLTHDAECCSSSIVLDFLAPVSARRAVKGLLSYSRRRGWLQGSIGVPVTIVALPAVALSHGVCRSQADPRA